MPHVALQSNVRNFNVVGKPVHEVTVDYRIKQIMVSGKTNCFHTHIVLYFYCFDLLNQILECCSHTVYSVSDYLQNDNDVNNLGRINYMLSSRTG